MNRLRILLQSDASKFIHLAIVGLLVVLSYSSYLAIILLIAEMLYLLRKHQRLAIYSLLLCLVLMIKIDGSTDSSELIVPSSGTVIEVFEDSFLLKSEITYLCYYQDTKSLYPGMSIELEARLIDDSGYNIMNTFDYSRYLKSQNIGQALYVYNLEIIDSHFHINLIQYKLDEYIKTRFSETASSYLRLFILGIKSDEYKLESETYSQLGIAHLFAISGMHITLLIAMLSMILKPLYTSKKTQQSFILVFLIFYNIITGFKISILRASLLVGGIYLTDSSKILLSKTDLIAFSGILFILINPYTVYSLGFQLSYLIALCLILGEELFIDSSKLIRIAKTSVFASAISLPLTLTINHEFGLAFIYANIFFILFVSYIFLPLSIICLLLPSIDSIYSGIIVIFDKAILFFDKINYLVAFSFPNNFYALLYWVFLILLLITYKQYKKRLLSLLALITVLLSSLYLNCESPVFVRFLDVGQGDAIHIHDHGCDMLIDTGDEDKYDTLINYFKSYNIRNIDILLITHFHTDHYGEMEDISENFNINTIYLSSDIENYGHDYLIAETGMCFSCGKAKFQVLSANHEDSNDNNNSIVLYAEIGRDKYLFTGDIEASIEAEIISQYKLDIDILKVPHHGSDTSSTELFIRKIKGEEAVISVGANNDYGHPSDKVLKRYEENAYQLLRSDESGTLTYYYYDFLPIRVLESFKYQRRRQFSLTFV